MKRFDRILLVDDDELTLKYNELIIEQAGFKSEIISVSDFNGASSLYKDSILKNTLILIDMNLENENALDLLKKLNMLPNYIASEHEVVILSSAVLLDYKEISESLPEVKKYIEKPLVLEELNML
jgi:response regulator of citrate/malate metabolism